MDDFSDARSLAASIKGGQVDHQHLYDDADLLAQSIKGGGKATHGLDTPAASDNVHYEPSSPPPPLVHGAAAGAVLAHSPMLIPSFYGGTTVVSTLFSLLNLMS